MSAKVLDFIEGLRLRMTMVLSFVLISLLSQFPDLPSDPDETEQGEEVFREQTEDNTLVVWKSLEVPENRTYDTIVVMHGFLDFYGKTENLVVVNGSARLQKGSEVRDQLVILRGQVEEMEGAFVSKTSGKKNWGWRWKPRWDTAKESIQDVFDKILHFNLFPSFRWMSLPFLLLIPFLGVLLFWLFGTLLFLVAPETTVFAMRFLQTDLGLTLGWGLCAWLVTVPVMALLVVSIVGILALPFFVVGVVLLQIGGFFCVAGALGSWLLAKRGIVFKRFSMLLGLIVIWLLLFVPFFNHLVAPAVLIAGCGSLLRALFDKTGKNTVLHS